MGIGLQNEIAVWVVTPNGLFHAKALHKAWPKAAVFVSHRLAEQGQGFEPVVFHRLTDAVNTHFHRFQAHVFIMATGIVVRSIAVHLKSKLTDPAVVAVDDRATFAVSLVSGHLGGANRLAEEVSSALGSTPVITTATDVNRKPAIDLLAKRQRLKIEYPANIKRVNMALLTGKPIAVHDPDNWLGTELPNVVPFSKDSCDDSAIDVDGSGASVWVGDALCNLNPRILILRPPSLVAGIGCNRNTPRSEIAQLLYDVMQRFHLASESLAVIASVDLKSDEPGIRELAMQMEIPLRFYTRNELATVKDVPSPSTLVAKHIGVPSVCEAAAILASRGGRLIVPKQKTRNVTVAIARRASTSSASARETAPIFPGEQEKS